MSKFGVSFFYTMEPRLIDLNDYILTGGGFMGESYNHKDNPELMLKM